MPKITIIITLLLLLPLQNLSAAFIAEKDECKTDLFTTANRSIGGRVTTAFRGTVKAMPVPPGRRYLLLPDGFR
jgi:hypothetical protein